MKIKRQRDFGSGLVFVMIGMAFAWAAGRWPLGTLQAPGPGLFAFLFGVLLTILGGAVLFTALTIESAAGDRIGRLGARVPALLLTVAGFGVAAPYGGLLLSVFAFGLVWHALERGLATVEDETNAASKWPRSPWRRHWQHWRGGVAQALALTVGAGVLFGAIMALDMPLWPRFLISGLNAAD